VNARPVTLDDKYRQPEGEVYLSGMQALVRLLLEQARSDRARGHRTGGFVSGYRGSPIGGLDRELWRAKALLEEHDVRFVPGLNEELAATACWGTQQVPLFPQPKVQGVFSLWYAKNPGVDRAMDAIKHGSHAGTSPLGGVLVAAGDDHLAKSSAFGHQSEYEFVDCLMPVLAPANIAEIVEFGLAGWALSRYCGSWVGLKLAGSICEGSATIDVAPPRAWPVPSFAFPPDGPHLRWPDDAGAMEHRAKAVRLPAAQAFVRAAGLDRRYGAQGSTRLGIVAPGRAHAQLNQALLELGIAERDLGSLGVRILKPAMTWPLEPEGFLEFAAGLDTLLVVEDKRPLVEDQAKVLLHDRMHRSAPRVIGKRDESGAALLPESGEIEAARLALELGRRLGIPESRLEPLRARLAPAPAPATTVATAGTTAAAATAPALPRTPYFCSGCPHNTSTRAPEGSTVVGGIGCHTLAMFMDRGMLTFTHMGGEGASWIGISPFSDLPHVFQNMGDGTYQHSGVLGIRAAVAANVNVTFKILYNDAVAMTGGQPVEGLPSVPRLTRQLAAEGVARIAVVTDDPDKYSAGEGSGAQGADPFAEGVRISHRDDLDHVQRELAKLPGVTALVYDQTCAAEKRRRRKVGQFPDPPKRLFINPRVCEGCGDCGVQSNCVSILPLETEFGRKRQIDQASCNKDYSCARGFCPSFVTVEGGTLRRPAPRDPGTLPEPPGRIAGVTGIPQAAARAAATRLLIAGIGGTGVVTVSAILGMAARLDSLEATVNDVTGMAQKGGPVLGHVQIADELAKIGSDRVPPGAADVLLALDLVVANMPDAASRLGARTVAIANLDVAPTGAFTRNVDALPDAAGLLSRLQSRVAGVETLHATQAAGAAAGDPVAAGLLMLGYALQRGLVPLRRESLEQAIRLNKVAVERNLAAFGWGRRLAAEPGAAAQLGVGQAGATTLDDFIARRVADLTDYQDAAYASRYRRLVERVREAEARMMPDEGALTRAVAEQAYRLMAYKDEYEVARLYADPAFTAQLAGTFEGDYRLRLNLAPPLLARRDRHTGLPRKREYGPWLLPVLRSLARLRRLRGTPFDPFGYTAERRMERRLVTEYFALVDELLASLSASRHAPAVELAGWPRTVRGFGHVKAKSLESSLTRRDALLAKWRT
jgi:indolepyruvate ferredoxin oxidoreductase